MGTTISKPYYLTVAAVVMLGGCGGFGFIVQLITGFWLDAEKKILRTTFGCMVGPTLDRLRRRQLILTLNLIFTRQRLAVVRQLHGFQSRSSEARHDDHRADGRAPR